MTTKLRFGSMAVAMVFWVAACSSGKQQAETGRQAEPPVAVPDTAEPVPIPTFDQTARLIAGMSVTDAPDYDGLMQTRGWRRHAAAMDSSWQRTDRERFAKMRGWAAGELDATAAGADVLYPFSGPDFVHVHAFFPQARQFYLFGLERTGQLPDFRRQSADEMVHYCEAMRGALRDIFKRSYFLTKRMSADLPQVNGVVPIICVFLVRTGHVVTKVQPLLLLENGQTMNWTGTEQPTATARPRLVRIDFTDATGRQPKSVFYYSGDLSDTGVKATPGLQAYLGSLPSDAVGYLKSASYLLHYESFATVRHVLTSKCKLVLQDDTGIAYKYFGKDWALQHYGEYVPPIEEFAGRFQRDLDAAYRDSTQVKPLPFDLGYHWGKHRDNLLRAVRQ